MKPIEKKVEQILYFHNTHNSMVYEIKDKTIIGRDEKCDICINDESISSKHLKIYLKNSHVFILDLGSSNGTKVNSINIAKDSDVKLRVGDNINIGNVCLQLSRKSKPLTSESNFSIITSREALYKPSLCSKNVNDLFSGSKPIRMIGFESEKENIHTQLKQLEIEKELLLVTLERCKQRQEQMQFLSYEIENFDKKNKTLFEKGTSLKEYYESNKEKYKDILNEIPRLEAKLKLLKITKEQMETQFKDFNTFNDLERKRSKYALEYKKINREKVDDQIVIVKNELRQTRVEIAKLSDEVDIINKNQKLKKDSEKEKIANEIKKLQEKLGDAS